MQDPTCKEMLKVLETCPFASETCDFDRASAIYWFANDWHGGQSSNLYSALSTSPYNPGPIASGPEDGLEADLYLELVNAFGSATGRS